MAQAIESFTIPNVEQTGFANFHSLDIIHDAVGETITVKGVSQVGNERRTVLIRATASDWEKATGASFDDGDGFPELAAQWLTRENVQLALSAGFMFVQEHPREFASLALDFTPIVGQLKGAAEAGTGVNWVTGEKLSELERGLALASILPYGAIVKVGKLAKGARIVEGVVDGVKVGKNVINGKTYIYSARELVRRTQDIGPFHNFPEAFNEEIFSKGTKSISKNFWKKSRSGLSNDSVMYMLPGEINGVAGQFEIAVRPSLSGDTELIMHRFFRPTL